MIVILSFSYIHSKLSNDIGNLPAMLLPVGNKKLLEHQVDQLRHTFKSESIVVVLPTDYRPSPVEQATIDGLSIQVQFADIDCEIADVLAQLLLNLSQDIDEPVRIQLGNIWLQDIPSNKECLAIADNQICSELMIQSDSSVDHSQFFNSDFFTNFAKTWIGYVSFASTKKLLAILNELNVKTLCTTTKSPILSNVPISLNVPISSNDAYDNRTDNQCLVYRYFANLIYSYQQNYGALTQVSVADWHNCNCNDGYFIARASLTTQRSFNTLFIRDGMVTKSSEDDQKIKAEAHWYNNTPNELSPFLPKLIACGYKDSGSIESRSHNSQYYYSLEYLPLFPLNELYVHGQSAPILWKRVFAGVQDIFAICADHKHLKNVSLNKLKQYSNYLYQHKTESRLKKFAHAVNMSLQQRILYDESELGSIEQISHHCFQLASNMPFIPAIMHGDLCFSNLLFDSATNKLKMIDPRGIDEHNNMSIFGDQTYDLAKLAHSVIGMYDFIVAGQYEIFETETTQGLEQTLHFYEDIRRQQIQEEFLNTEFIAGFATQDIMPAVVLLFLSMLPLHADRPDRQQAMLLNAFRLYKTFVLPQATQVVRQVTDQAQQKQRYHYQSEYSVSESIAS